MHSFSLLKCFSVSFRVLLPPSSVLEESDLSYIKGSKTCNKKIFEIKILLQVLLIHKFSAQRVTTQYYDSGSAVLILISVDCGSRSSTSQNSTLAK